MVRSKYIDDVFAQSRCASKSCLFQMAVVLFPGIARTLEEVGKVQRMVFDVSITRCGLV